jgi:hypothetical protein
MLGESPALPLWEQSRIGCPGNPSATFRSFHPPARGSRKDRCTAISPLFFQGEWARLLAQGPSRNEAVRAVPRIHRARVGRYAMANSVTFAICILLLISGSVEVYGKGLERGWGATHSQWSDEKCPESFRSAENLARADVKTFLRRHPSGLWSGFVASFGAKRKLCRTTIRRAYLAAARKYLEGSRSVQAPPWDRGGRYERNRMGDR